MRYSVVFLEPQFGLLVSHLFSGGGKEQAAFLLCRQSVTSNSTSLLVRKVIPVEMSDVTLTSNTHMNIRSRAYLRAMKEADSSRHSFVFVHSHPSGFPEFSSQDDHEEAALFRTAHIRIHHDVLHASLVFSGKDVFR